MAITDDPRENLVLFGQDLLDATYKLTLHHEEQSAFLDKYRDAAPEDLSEQEMLAQIPEALHFLIQDTILHEARDEALNKYIVLRRTLEALDAPRQDVPTPAAETESKPWSAPDHKPGER